MMSTMCVMSARAGAAAKAEPVLSETLYFLFPPQRLGFRSGGEGDPGLIFVSFC